MLGLVGHWCLALHATWSLHKVHVLFQLLHELISWQEQSLGAQGPYPSLSEVGTGHWSSHCPRQQAAGSYLRALGQRHTSKF